MDADNIITRLVDSELRKLLPYLASKDPSFIGMDKEGNLYHGPCPILKATIVVAIGEDLYGQQLIRVYHDDKHVMAVLDDESTIRLIDTIAPLPEEVLDEIVAVLSRKISQQKEYIDNLIKRKRKEENE